MIILDDGRAVDTYQPATSQRHSDGRVKELSVNMIIEYSILITAHQEQSTLAMHGSNHTDNIIQTDPV